MRITDSQQSTLEGMKSVANRASSAFDMAVLVLVDVVLANVSAPARDVTDPRLGNPLPKFRMMLDAILTNSIDINTTEGGQYMMVEVRRLRQLRDEMEKV